MIPSKSYDSSTGKHRRTCVNPACAEPFWGRKDQQYCGKRCKNAVNNAKWRLENPKLTEKERIVRNNYRILMMIAEKNGYNKWIDLKLLSDEGFNGKLFHSYSLKTLKDNTQCKVLSIFDLQLHLHENNQFLINKPL